MTMLNITLRFDSDYDATKASSALSREADRLEKAFDKIAGPDAPIRAEIASLRVTADQLTAGLREPV
jgi:hypothetical protein